MSKATLLELADRVEKASGPDRELDAEIHFEVFTQHEPHFTNADRALGAIRYFDTKRGDWGRDQWRYWPDKDHAFGINHYTASLDAVRTLDGLCVFASDIGADGLACVKLVADTSTTPVIEHTGIAQRLEHAWLAAALRARAQQESSDADQ